jgi:hypothetical protein
MGKAKTPHDYQILAQRLGYTWLGPLPPRSTDKTRWLCNNQHEFETSYATIRHGHGCNICAGNRPKTPEDYHGLARTKGFSWLGPFPRSTTHKTRWQCNGGHEFTSSYNLLLYHGCNICMTNRPKTPDDYRALAHSKGLSWLGPLPQGVRQPTTWQCDQGHEFEMSYTVLARPKNGCNECSGQRQKTPKDYHYIAKERGFEWLGPLPQSTSDKTQWLCRNGHIWETSYTAIAYAGHDCAHCASRTRKTEADYHARAARYGHIWLGPYPASTHEKTTWRCTCGHTWETSYNGLRGCRKCSYAGDSAGERAVLDCLKQHGIPYEREKRFDACRHIHVLPFDFYLPDYRILIEYQGKQHFHPVDFSGKDKRRAEKAYRTLLKRDAIKREYAASHGFHLIEIPYTVDDVDNFLISALDSYRPGLTP